MTIFAAVPAVPRILPAHETPSAAPPAAAGSFGTVYVPVPDLERWRCVVFDSGYGRIVGTSYFAGQVASYRVALDAGGELQVPRNHVRRLAMLRVVA